MFKKTLLALALTGLAGTATAAEINPAGEGVVSGEDHIKLVSAEGAVKANAAKYNGVVVTIEGSKDGYKNLKVVTVSIEGATLAAGTNAALETSGVVVAANVPVVDSNGNAVVDSSNDPVLEDVEAEFDVTFPNATTAVFTINNKVEGGDIIAGDTSTLTISGLELALDSVSVGAQVKYTVTTTSSIANAKIETESAVVSQVVQQLSASVAENAKLGQNDIDVEAGRMVFADDTKSDSVTVTKTVKAVDIFDIDNTDEVVTYTLNGDFSFLDADKDGVVDEGFTLSGELAEDAQSVVLEDENVFTFTTEGDVVLPAQSFTVDVEYDYETAAGDSATFSKKGIEAGTWKLNGSEDKVGFVPFGSQYARSITVANFGNIEGEITVELNVDGEFQSKVLTATSTKNSIVDISKEVDAFAEELGVTGNAAMKVIVDAPKDNIRTDVVYFAKADKDRVKTN